MIIFGEIGDFNEAKQKSIERNKALFRVSCDRVIWKDLSGAMIHL